MTSFSFRLCADDLAVSPAVTDGILEAVAAGRVSSTGAMTNQSDWRRAAALIATAAGQAEFGVHLNFTLGTPLSRMPVLAPDGRFPELGRFLGLAMTGRLPEAEIRTEITAQLDAFEDGAGFPPDFVDGHQHVQGIPRLRNWLFDELARRRMSRPGFWLRDSGDRMHRILARRSHPMKALVVKALTAGFGQAAVARGFEINDGFAGFSGFDPLGDYGREFARYLAAPGSRHLVMCHPGRCDDDLRTLESVVESRLLELEFLMSDRFPECLERAGASLVSPPGRDWRTAG